MSAVASVAPSSTPDAFQAMLGPVYAAIAGRSVDAALGEHLARLFPTDGDFVRSVEAACHAAIAAGWMCTQGGEGRRFGRVVEPAPDTHQLSVDVVELTDIIGPHHRHPNGEICLIMPVTPTATFDGRPRGWCVYGPNSGHRPTVRDGQALVLYLLPDGAIEFTGR
jgi:hypothetical protein